ncbi:hypothetical protein QBK99_10925 [Corticibacterium sp. UT-5YL-CI-8]|nr:hypothetical protein [Tianweitania sp. UT-5YL-CI-8]
MDRAKFFAGLRARGSGVFGTSLSQGQVSGTEAILDEAQARGVPLRHLAYILATAYHETAHTMQPIAEYGKGKGRKYGIPAGPDNQVYYGRGYVQLTWLANYAKAGKKLGVDFVRYPERAMDPRLAAQIMFLGMAEGWFTGKKLSDYIDGDKADYANARRIINGTDKKDLIAGYAKAFETALRAAGYFGMAPKVLPTPKPIPVTTPEPSIPKASEPKKADPVISIPEPSGFWASLIAYLFPRKA